MQQSSRPVSLPMNIRVKHPIDGPIFSPMTYSNPYMPPVPTSIPMGIMQSHMKPMSVNFFQLPFPIPFTVLAQSGSNEQANILANFRMDTSQRPPHPQPTSDTDENRVDELANFQVLPHGYWDYRAILIHNMPSFYNVSEFLHLGRFGTLERVVPMYDRNQLFLAFLSAADALDFYNTVRYTDFTFKKQRLIVTTIDPMPLDPRIIDACNRGFVSRNVQISGLPSDFNEATLIQYVCSLGKTELISVCTETRSIYIHYLSIEDALHCIDSVLSNPYYNYLSCFCFYERCDRYYATDYQVEKVEPGITFSKPKAEVNALKSNEAVTQKKEIKKKPSAEKLDIKSEPKPFSTKCNSQCSFEGITKKEESNNLATVEEKNLKPAEITRTKAVRISDPEVIPFEKPFEKQKHSSPKKSCAEPLSISENATQNNSTTSPSSKTNVSSSVLECHSKIAALQNVTNTSSVSSPTNSVSNQSSKMHASSVIPPVVNKDVSSTPQLPSKSEYPQDQPTISPKLNESNVLRTNTKSQWCDDLSSDSKPDATFDDVEDINIMNKGESLQEHLNDMSNSLYPSNWNDELKHEPSPATMETLRSDLSPSTDIGTQKNTSLNTILEEQEPDRFESLLDSNSLASLPKEYTGDNPVNDLTSLAKLSTESYSSRSSSALTSPTLVDSPLEAPAKTFTDLSELFEMDIISKLSNNSRLIPDLEPCSKNRTLFLSSFHRATKQFEIANLFKKFPLEEIHYLSKKKICFVTFLESYDAKLFLNAHKKESPYLHGRPLKMEWAKFNNPFTDELLNAVANGASRSISFEKIHPNITRGDLSSVFKIYGPIESFHFSKHKNAGTITYNSIYSAIKAMKHLQSHPTFEQTVLNYYFDDHHSQKIMPYKKQPYYLEETKGKVFSRETLSQGPPKYSSCFDTLGSYSPSHSKSTNLRRPKRATISSEA
ncbi:RNA binding [Schizosaccharomyces osmophilus]|uniref:RNA binding n=1 Tax=Schizosaccharomyces osmophilus TaxID=2545709 RepID=A0AAE9WDE2_9SCHI|nr:RNA binding [Schizosaccharomyces osmophilus]WBW74145.1 RNA binding [Schizosaccharomyces osmophilus]